MKHEMKLQPIYFEKIKDGEKIYEIRLNDEKRQQISVGDVIVFYKQPSLSKAIVTVVTELKHFSSFQDLANALPKKDLGFYEDADVDEIMHQFYSKEDEQKFGVLAIKIRAL